MGVPLSRNTSSLFFGIGPMAEGERGAGCAQKAHADILCHPGDELCQYFKEMVMSINHVIRFNYLYRQYKGYNQAASAGRTDEFGMDYAIPLYVTR